MHYLDEILSDHVPSVLEKYHILSNKKCSDLDWIRLRLFFLFIVPLISNEISIKLWNFYSNKYRLQSFIEHQ